MALAGTAARLLASLDLDTKPFERGAKRVDGSLGKMEGKFGKVSTRAIAFGSAVGVGVERLAEKGISVLFDSIRSGEEGLRVLQDTQAQTGAVIESTGGKAGVTAEKVRELAEAQESLTTVDDKVVQAGENMLLTFTNIGSDVFPDATKAMVDMAVAMNGGNAEGIDLSGTAIQLGKALNDPVKGITALQRVGVTFSKTQKKQIKDFVEAGDVASAQGVILKELETEFGKAGEAAGTSGAAGVRRLSDAVEDTQIQLATGLSPALERIRGKLAKALGDPKTQDAVKHLGEWLGDAAEKGVEFASKIPWGQVADGLRTAAGFAGDLVKVFVNMPPEVQGSILALAGLNKISGGAVTGIVGELGKGLIKGVLGMNAGVVNINSGRVNGGAGAGAGAGGGGIAGAVGIAAAGAAVVQGVMDVGTIAEGVKRGYEANEKGDIQGVLDAQKGIFDNVVMFPPGVRELAGILQGQEQAIVDAIKGGIEVKPQGISPDERQELNDLQAKAETQRQKMEAVRNAAERTKASVDWSRQATVAAGHSDAQMLANTIRANRAILTVSVTTNTVVRSMQEAGVYSAAHVGAYNKATNLL